MGEKIAKVTARRELAPHVLLFDAAMEEPGELGFRAGQFLSVRIDDAGKVRRSYSLASSPARRDGFELLVKVVPGGGGSAYFNALAEGMDLHFTGPMGFFVNEEHHLGDAVYAATGSGIAAALPMAEEAALRPDEAGQVVLYWGLRQEADVYFRDRLDALVARAPRFRYELCLSSPASDWTGCHGRINEHVLRAVNALQSPVFYLVGNGEMVREVKEQLQKLGVDRKKHIKNEIFYPVAEP